MNEEQKEYLQRVLRQHFDKLPYSLESWVEICEIVCDALDLDRRWLKEMMDDAGIFKVFGR